MYIYIHTYTCLKTPSIIIVVTMVVVVVVEWSGVEWSGAECVEDKEELTPFSLARTALVSLGPPPTAHY